MQAHGIADGVAETMQALGGVGLNAEKIDQDMHIFIDDGLKISVAAIIQHLVPIGHLTGEESPQQEHAFRHIEQRAETQGGRCGGLPGGAVVG